MEWETVIGLEIHAQLLTKSKIFSGASTAFGAEPNTQACLVDLGYPGVLPVLNKEAVRMAVKFGLAVGARIAPRSVFARKNYFYPDLPKGYQISQYELPVVSQGSMEIELEDGGSRRIGITRAHLEEDAGKSLHEGGGGVSGIDLNRAGTPLLEIVSEPDMRSVKEAVAYMKKIHSLVRYLEICDGNMQEGSFRCDANVSVRRKGEQKFGTRAELKNINSFHFVEKAILYEVQRQIEIIEGGGKVMQETRLYDSKKNQTRSMRSKEEANDYRYFPDPDLLPLEIAAAFIEEVRKTLPELPDEKQRRFMHDYGLSVYDAALLTASRELADFYESVVKAVGGEAKLCANWVMGELSASLNQDSKDVTQSPVTAVMLAGLLRRILDNTISGKLAKEVFLAMWAGEGEADTVIEKQGLKQITDSATIERIIDEVVSTNPQHPDGFAAAYAIHCKLRQGAESACDFFAGVHGQPPPDVTGRVVYLVDFSYRRPVLKEMCRKARSVLVIDHHTSAEQDLTGLEHEHNNLRVIFDMNKSGAVVWEHFHDTPPPQLFLYIQDRDLWRFELESTNDVYAALMSRPFDFANLENFCRNDRALEHLVNEGRAINRYRRRMIDLLREKRS